VQEIAVPVQHLDRFVAIAGEAPVAEVLRRAEELRAAAAGRTIWNLNSTARGGGVSELLRGLVGYARGTGLDARWLVIDGTPGFFEITKRLHHALHGSPGDGRPLDESATELYARVLAENAAVLADLVRPGDVVVLHDPQTAGLLRPLRKHGARVIWRCHIGSDVRNEETARGWAFLEPYLWHAEKLIFSRPAYVPPMLEGAPLEFITPTIDPFTPKNQELRDTTVRAMLGRVGLIEGPTSPGDCEFLRTDGAPGRVDRRAELVREAPDDGAPWVVQVSRWDSLKDPRGVMEGFVRWLARPGGSRARLLLVGPSLRAIADDPEGAVIYEQVLADWQRLPREVRARIDLVSLPMVDIEENAAIVNAIQRHATLVVQKSLAEGFGLTVTEAMWKRKPVLASAVGGITDQVVDGETGWLLRDPRDLDRFAQLLDVALRDPGQREQFGARGHARVVREFLGLETLLRYARVIASLE
jgi:trehalose synthase